MMLKKDIIKNKRKGIIMNTNVKNKSKGITLIALVITIIVLLILAGVTIATLTGENGILTRASDIDVETRAASVEERKNLWKTEKQTDNYVGENTAQTLGELLDDLEGEDLITAEERTKIEETGHVVIGSKDISFSDGLTETSYTITSSLDEVNFSKIITEGDITIEKPGFTNYTIEGVSASQDGEYVTSGSVAGKSGNLEIIGDISDATFSYTLTNFMQGDETFYCKINIDGEEHYKEIKIIQGDVVAYEENFVGITYTGPWYDEENENFTNGKAKWTDDITTNLKMQMYGTAVDIRTVKGENIGRFSCAIQEINQDNNLGQILYYSQLDFEDTVNEIVNFSDLMEKRMYFDRNDNSNVRKVQMTITKMKKNVEEQTGDTKVYIDTIYVYR